MALRNLTPEERVSARNAIKDIPVIYDPNYQFNESTAQLFNMWIKSDILGHTSTKLRGRKSKADMTRVLVYDKPSNKMILTYSPMALRYDELDTLTCFECGGSFAEKGIGASIFEEFFQYNVRVCCPCHRNQTYFSLALDFLGVKMKILNVIPKPRPEIQDILELKYRECPTYRPGLPKEKKCVVEEVSAETSDESETNGNRKKRKKVNQKTPKEKSTKRGRKLKKEQEELIVAENDGLFDDVSREIIETPLTKLRTWYKWQVTADFEKFIGNIVRNSRYTDLEKIFSLYSMTDSYKGLVETYREYERKTREEEMKQGIIEVTPGLESNTLALIDSEDYNDASSIHADTLLNFMRERDESNQENSFVFSGIPMIPGLDTPMLDGVRFNNELICLPPITGRALIPKDFALNNGAIFNEDGDVSEVLEQGSIRQFSRDEIRTCLISLEPTTEDVAKADSMMTIPDSFPESVNMGDQTARANMEAVERSFCIANMIEGADTPVENNITTTSTTASTTDINENNKTNEPPKPVSVEMQVFTRTIETTRTIVKFGDNENESPMIVELNDSDSSIPLTILNPQGDKSNGTVQVSMAPVTTVTTTMAKNTVTNANLSDIIKAFKGCMPKNYKFNQSSSNSKLQTSASS